MADETGKDDRAKQGLADDIVTRLRTVQTFTADNCEELSLITDNGADEIERLQAIVATVDDLHSCRLAHDTCLACDHDWPCPTHPLIHPEEVRRG